MDKLAAEKFKDIEFNKIVPVKDFPGKYLQYRLLLIAEDGINTPRVDKVTLNFK